jgi:hypothetical protein
VSPGSLAFLAGCGIDLNTLFINAIFYEPFNANRPTGKGKGKGKGGKGKGGQKQGKSSREGRGGSSTDGTTATTRPPAILAPDTPLVRRLALALLQVSECNDDGCNDDGCNHDRVPDQTRTSDLVEDQPQQQAQLEGGQLSRDECVAAVADAPVAHVMAALLSVLSTKQIVTNGSTNEPDSSAQRAYTTNATPLVLHNGWLDLAYIVHSFVAPLSTIRTLKSFIEVVMAWFPCIYDTKYLVSGYTMPLPG